MLIVGAAIRFYCLRADPPYWDEGSYMTDEGWWADSARGKVLFDNYFSDDFGTGYLVTPGYTWLLMPIYRIAGVGNAQTRLLAASSNFLIILLVVLALWKGEGPLAALIGAAVLSFSPFFWSFAREGLIEPTQTLFMTLGFTLWILFRRKMLGALAAGLAFSYAVAVKPNSVSIGLVPVVLGVLLVHGIALFNPSWDPRKQGEGSNSQEFLFALFGLAIGGGVIFIIHVLPNWTPFWAMVRGESGAGALADWKEYVKTPGRMFASDFQNRTDIMWRVAHYGPVLVAGVWLYVLALLLRLKQGAGSLLREMTPIEAASLVWVIVGSGFILISRWPYDRRFVINVPPAAVITAITISRLLQGRLRAPAIAQERKSGPVFNFIFWAVLLFPVLVIFKPPVTNILVTLRKSIPIAPDKAVGTDSAGTLFMAGWFAMLVVLALWARRSEKLGQAIVNRAGVCIFAALFIFGLVVLGNYFVHLEAKLSDEQAELAKIVGSGETVLGHPAATIFQSLKVRTVRRVRAEDMTGAPNMDVWERLQPRYILEITRRNWALDNPIYADLTAEDYRVVHHFGMGRVRWGVPRYEYDVYERIQQ